MTPPPVRLQWDDNDTSGHAVIPPSENDAAGGTEAEGGSQLHLIEPGTITLEVTPADDRRASVALSDAGPSPSLAESGRSHSAEDALADQAEQVAVALEETRRALGRLQLLAREEQQFDLLVNGQLPTHEQLVLKLQDKFKKQGEFQRTSAKLAGVTYLVQVHNFIRGKLMQRSLHKHRRHINDLQTHIQSLTSNLTDLSAHVTTVSGDLDATRADQEATRALLTSTQHALESAVTEYRGELRRAWDALGRQNVVVESLVSSRVNRDIMVDLVLLVLAVYATGFPLVSYPMDALTRGLTALSIALARRLADRPAPDPSRLLLSEAVQIKRRERDLRLFISATIRSLLVWGVWRRAREFARSYRIYGPPSGYSYWDIVGQYVDRTTGMGWVVGWSPGGMAAAAEGVGGGTEVSMEGSNGGPSDFHEREQRILRAVRGMAERGRRLGEPAEEVNGETEKESGDGKGKGKDVVRE
ncbi:hypothetical protein M427DRAFT_54903 [Gonapodya prolifera JEL478]|uniref:Uncharacterized protein n=1 Tax=Gonapodya prolifera (strain JEL478) TaxID=1344416 RepID=A0A139ALE5_GONPJ|nr:hypothetical protein M427DRAFT_54903 [Gonapodya prolifera JEL478]|eukprot:KXS17245.1 hypothetical protein M427DRAFT_54903 [Gonapodya prolifera JEL478]